MPNIKRMADSDSGLIQIVDQIIQAGVRGRASDIHIEPEADAVRIRYRVDGVLRDAGTHPRSLHEPMVSRVKILANLDISERRGPQDGRFQHTVDERAMDFRVSVFPTIHGENVALRVLDTGTVVVGLDHLGMSDDQLALYRQIINKPYGIVFVTGPSGSGKTTSIYSTLNTINSSEKNIVTLEDPVEYQLPLIRQTEIDPDAGLTFVTGLRFLLRQDPDIILVGEIRDAETAEIGIRAALTGHLVFTSLHTNDSVGAVARLSDMGIEPVLIASATIGVISQRLVRTVCPTCVETYKAPPELLQRLGLNSTVAKELVRAKGCAQCGYTGYQGRTAIFEVFQPDEEIRSLIATKASYDVISKIARQKGMRVLRDHGWEKALAKVTTIEEVLRVTSE